MEIIFKESFLKDLKKIKNNEIKQKILEIISTCEKAKSLNEIKDLKKLRGYKNFFRIKIGNYRVGLQIKENKVFFVRILHRKDIYKYFP